MPDAHLPSDDTAIAAAQDSLTTIARRVLLQRVDEHLRRPTRWSHEALVAASAAVWDRHVADLEAALGKERGALGSEQGAGFAKGRIVPRRKAVCAETDGDCA